MVVSAAKCEANRRNAQKSTGPRHKHTWSELRSAGHTIINPKMPILATDELHGRHPIE
jgi:hypothetical protein